MVFPFPTSASLLGCWREDKVSTQGERRAVSREEPALEDLKGFTEPAPGLPADGELNFWFKLLLLWFLVQEGVRMRAGAGVPTASTDPTSMSVLDSQATQGRRFWRHSGLACVPESPLPLCSACGKPGLFKVTMSGFYHETGKRYTSFCFTTGSRLSPQDVSGSSFGFLINPSSSNMGSRGSKECRRQGLNSDKRKGTKVQRAIMVFPAVMCE